MPPPRPQRAIPSALYMALALAILKDAKEGDGQITKRKRKFDDSQHQGEEALQVIDELRKKIQMIGCIITVNQEAQTDNTL